MNFCPQTKGSIRRGEPSIAVGLVEFYSGVDACQRESSQRQSITWKRVLP